ncbi:RlpA-like double-psi beta-barrel-protein domain-containing protein-containing protein [Lactarius akahatsu]|uniref:RlpA-like double-psi beta-barrel-protein domain-containing protein-containing protein n=1 Tax=Lactarius akahatsu TaxID=416441 RepID=A0AAD4QHE2_9AGAM|nr:RlpA-like double-psi beta-barrel-protein domain-containing protein-containing protein [Lactarius akahatsu]
MRALMQSIVTVLFFTLVQLISAQARKSHEKRSPGSIQRRHTTHLAKRFANARFTYYVDGTGACGHYNKPSDFIVALNAAQYGGGEYCGKTITMTYGGKSTQAVIVDRCPGCPYGGLDLSQGLFSFFASTDLGTIYGEWVFGSSEEPKPTSTTPTSTSTPQPSPTTTKKLATSTTSPITSSTTTTSKPSSTTNSVPSSSSSTTTTTLSSSVSTTSPTPGDDVDALSQMALALVQLCTFVEDIIAE